MPETLIAFARNVNRLVSTDLVRDASPIRNIGALLAETTLRRRIIRPDDLFAADFLFHNLKFVAGDPSRLTRRVASRTAYLAIELQGQHFGEEVLLLAGATPKPSPDHVGLPRNAPPPPPRVMRARLAYPSRIVVRMPDTEAGIDYTLDALLGAITTWPLSLDALARAPAPQIFADLSDAVLVRQTVERAAELLQSTVAELQADIVGRGNPDLARAVVKQADRAAMIAVDAVGRKAAPAKARAMAAALKRQLSSDKSLNEETREAANALFELRLAAKAAETSFELAPLASVVDLFDISKVFLLLLAPHEPSDLVTALEIPYRLIQSPHAGATFAHPSAPVDLAGRTELWRTTLAERTASGSRALGRAGAAITAMWSPDYCGSDPVVKKDPFRMSLFPRHRNELVRLMSGHQEKRSRVFRYIPKPATLHRLQLSALGGVLELDGAWSDTPTGVNLEAWKHDASYGRDERVEVVEAGFLYPYGHRASLVTLTERLVDRQNPTGVAAFLRQRQFIILREFEKDFPAQQQMYDGRKLPFTKLTCVTRRSPDLQQESADAVVTVPPEGKVEAFWPIAIPGAAPAKFDFEGIDLAGRRVVFSSPVIFIFKSFIDTNAAQMYLIDAAWNGTPAAPNPRALVSLAGQTVRMAPVGTGTPGDVDVPVDAIIFEATPAAGQRPPYHPAVAWADAQLKALAAVTGRRNSQRVRFEAAQYLPYGYANNAWKVFLELKTAHRVAMGPDVPTDRVGGIGQPTQSLSAISNGSGAVSGTVSALTAGTVQPNDMFPEAKILGGFDLKDLIAPFVVAAAGAIPGFKTEEFPDKVVTSWSFKDDDVHSPVPGLKTGAGGKKSALELGAKLTAHFTYPDPDLGFKNKNGEPAPDFGAGTDPGWKDPEAEATGKLTNFKLNFFGFVTVWFDEFSFKSTLKNKFDPNPKLNKDHPVVFGGPLEFVNKLSELIPSGGFSDPPIIKPSLTDLQVGYDFKLPNVEVGIFALKNMKIGAVLVIPFTGDPVALRFFFSTRESPFLLTVSLFGGGGFFALVTTADGVKEIEAAFEFGAFAAFNAGIASGGVYVKAGVYFHWKANAVELEGYVEMGGELSVAGIVSVSITLHLSLGYYKEAGSAQVRGQATLTIEVEVLFFSVSFKAQIERRFAGSSGDPTFAQLITDQSTWARYCAAFG